MKFKGILIKQCSINNIIVVHMFQNQQVVQVSAIQGLKLRYRYLHPFQLTVSVDPDVPKQMANIHRVNDNMIISPSGRWSLGVISIYFHITWLFV